MAGLANMSQFQTGESQRHLAMEQPICYFNWDQRQQARSCMETLVQALSEDPVNSYFSGSKRRMFVQGEVKGYLKALPAATNFIATADSLAVALWQLLPLETPRNELLAGWTRIFNVPPRLWGQLLKLELHYESAHEEIAKQVGSYYYLSFIGTKAESRGKGYGSRLLSHITQRADAEGRWCLLEATSEMSQALYARHGFVTYEIYRVSSKAPPVFFMKRPPTAALVAAAAIMPAIAEAAVVPIGAPVSAIITPAAVVTGAMPMDLAAAVAAKQVAELLLCKRSSSKALEVVQVMSCDSSDCGSDWGSAADQQLITAGPVFDIEQDNEASTASKVTDTAAEAVAVAGTVQEQQQQQHYYTCSACDVSSEQQSNSSQSSSSAGAGGPIAAA